MNINFSIQLTVLEGVTEEVYLVVQGCHRSLWGIERGGERFCRTYAMFLVLPNKSSTPQGDNLCVCVESVRVIGMILTILVS